MPERDSLLAGVRRVLVVHAHPDDEVLAGGALLRELHDRGVRVALVTCSRGEAGEIVDGVLPDRTSEAELAEVREREVRGSVEALGIAAHYWLGMPPARAASSVADAIAGPDADAGEDPDTIAGADAGTAIGADTGTKANTDVNVHGHAGAGTSACVRAHAFADATAFTDARTYRDSGMQWVRPGVAGPADSSDARSFTAAPLAEVVADLAAVVAVERPEVIVSYDDAGGYGHPDHLRAREAALAVARASGIRFAELIDDPSVPDTEWSDLEHQRAAVLEALRSHRTQLTVDADGRQLTHSGGQRQHVETDIGLRIVT